MMGRTLFWYIFRDLLKIFLMANGALSGIMSFGGLLRPLTHQGLDVGQVTMLLTYFAPAMMTYSLPIAALFATTVVYGRLSADNELTACRAGGLSHLTVAFPAFVMGVFVAILSLVFLCFIVPVYTLKVEQTLYSNMAKLIAGSIQNTHHIRFGPVTIFAQDAYLPPENFNPAGQQMVVLKGPTIETIERPFKNERDYHIPRDFYTASEADIYIEQQGKAEQRGTGKVYLRIRLEDGVKFPRQFEGALSAGVETTSYGPLEIDSPIKEDTKFMDVWRLKRLYHDPARATKIKRVINDFVQRDQQISFANDIARELNTKGQATFEFGAGETYVLKREPDSPLAFTRGGIVIIPAAPPAGQLSAWVATQVSADLLAARLGVPPLVGLPMGAESDYRPITFQRRVEGQSPPLVAAREAHLNIRPSGEANSLQVNLELFDSLSRTGNGVVERRNFPQPFLVPIRGDVEKIASRGVPYYAHLDPSRDDRQKIGRELLQLSNQILAESNSRVSFAISCLVLVMVGCALGLMFRSGNFLSAFAISFVPALLTITLIVAGQRISGNIPDDLKVDIARYVNTPLKLGLSLIWTGNCINFVLAVVLLGRLQKQ
ncbi:MAG TPA: LptF/LptG family permease [Tepidisphaeraceae bacterium]|nr:LptF/LptG family permease [Tepidisphaeraceae bacterium]